MARPEPKTQVPPISKPEAPPSLVDPDWPYPRLVKAVFIEVRGTNTRLMQATIDGGIVARVDVLCDDLRSICLGKGESALLDNEVEVAR
jgi:hypothetical protein